MTISDFLYLSSGKVLQQGYILFRRGEFLRKEGINMKRNKEFFRGCLLGGAIGDALGRPVEFMKFEEITRHFSNEGITDLIVGENGKADITDDTQMTIFTSEGLLRAYTRGNSKSICHIPTVVHNAYLRWLHTQGQLTIKEDNKLLLDSWLLNVGDLYARRGPGNTCLTALNSGVMGEIEKPLNNSKGCGGVMRSAPIGLFFTKDEAFKIACECAALTHGHPSGYISAGILAHSIAGIIDGMEITEAVEDALQQAVQYNGHEECTRITITALELSQTDLEAHDAIKKLGEGWVGEEALAISLYCAIKYNDDFKKAVIAAVNHDGDSDSTGAITGNILGAYLGVSSIQSEWIERLELTELLTKIADDLLTRFQDTRDWWDMYPGF